MLRRACVFIGASDPTCEIYSAKIKALSEELVRRNLSVAYGGARVGLMGVLADTMLEMRGEVIGVIPNVLLQKEIAHPHLTELHRVDTMQDRKKMLTDLADLFIIFPGGLGTLEEFFEVWNAAKIGLHQKPIGILNIDGYFDNLINSLNGAVKKGFLKQHHFDLIHVSHEPSGLLDHMMVE